ncbi:MAG: cation transporter, partial [Actinomycetota bacterium]
MSHAEHSHGIGQGGVTRSGQTGAGRGLVIGIALNLAIVAVEVAAGIVAGSLGLLSDAVHNFTDMAALAIA